MTPRDARDAALEALLQMERRGAWSDGSLKRIAAQSGLEARDAALCTRMTYGVVQNRMLLDFYLAQAVASPLTKLQPVVLDILRLGAYQILFLDKIPVSAAVNEAVEQTKTYANKRAAGLVNGSLRTLARRKDELEKPHDLATKYSHPQPLVDCLRASMDEETLEAFLAADNDIPKTALQANPLKASAEQVAAALDEAGIACEPHPWLPGCFLVSGTGNLESLPLFQSGAVYVQDAAAKLAVLASGAAPGMRVLDCCAAPGGKSFAAAMQMENTGSILSCDLHAHKISLIEKNAARLGISILKAEQRSASEFDPALEAQFDLVIADVPCSGLGVIRKKPDIRYKPLDAIERLPEVQRAILETVSRYVKPGGALLYSTCTVRKEENEAVALPFLQAHPEFSLEPFPVPDGLDLPNEGYAALLPHKHAADGFFICKLRKHA